MKMLVQAVVTTGLKYVPPRIFQRSSKHYNKFLRFLTAPQLSVSKNYSVSAEVEIFNEVHFQKYLNYMENKGCSSKRQSEETEQLVSLLKKKRELENEIKNLEIMSSECDKELEKLIQSEKKQYLDSIEEMKDKILWQILPKNDDDNDNRNIELKIVPGIGGEEARLFSEELFHMYMNYAEFKNWECIGDYKNGFLLINGEYVFGHLKHEAGVHRVQRVPVTETFGRIQSSTCSVVILPQPRVNEVHINEKDVTVEKMRSSGPGGQNVNKRETCIRIKHIPTGIVVENQTNRLQQQNLKVAFDRLRTILFNIEQKKMLLERKTSFKKQVGLNDYSDKIRTYNFQQNRVTDHRMNQSIQNLKGFLSGAKELDRFIQQLRKGNLRKELLLIVANTLESVEYKAFEKEQNGLRIKQ